jgi:hypothetical protein
VGERSTVETRVQFRRVGYAVVPELLPEAACAFLFDYAVKAARHGQLEPGDDDVPGTPCRYADPFMETLLQVLLPPIGSATGLELYPTYSYFRVYQHGDALPPHCDRPACEVSATISLGYHAAAPWPIWIEAKGGPAAVALKPGDAMLYRGVDLRHWRDRFDGTQAVQVFLHYVDQHGDHCQWKFDRRPALASSTAALRTLTALMATGGRSRLDDA